MENKEAYEKFHNLCHANMKKRVIEEKQMLELTKSLFKDFHDMEPHADEIIKIEEGVANSHVNSDVIRFVFIEFYF